MKTTMTSIRQLADQPGDMVKVIREMYPESMGAHIERALDRTALDARMASADDNVIHIAGVIDEIDWASYYGGLIPGTTARRVRAALRKIGAARDVTVEINSPGGLVTEGYEIYNVLAQHKGNVEVRINGIAASIAQLIAMAGDTIVMGDASMQFVHSPWLLAVGDAEEMRKTANDLDKMQEISVAIVAKRSGLERDEVEGYFNADTLFTAEEAVELGLADGVWSEEKEPDGKKMLYNSNPKPSKPVNDPRQDAVKDFMFTAQEVTHAIRQASRQQAGIRG